MLGLQVILYALALFGLLAPAACRMRAVSISSAFLMLNMACWLAFFVWVSGAASTSWKQVQYEPPA